MDEILQNLLENEILDDATKTELTEAIQSQISEAVSTALDEAKAELETSIRAELAEQFVTDKEALVEALDTKATQLLEAELAELKDDVENYRDLEAEYAEKIVNAKAELAERAKKDFKRLVDILNEFLEERVAAEFEELKEDIEEVKRNKFGQKIFETFKDVFESTLFDKDEVDRQAQKTKSELEKVSRELKEARQELSKTVRQSVLNETLSALDGRPREVMAAILANTPTDKIPSVYEQFIGRVLNEAVVKEDAEKETTEEVLAEDSKTQSKKDETLTETVKVTGDAGKEPIIEHDEGDSPKLSKEAVNRLRNLVVG